MKTIKPFVAHLGMVCLLAALLIGGCKKELADDSTKIKKPDLLLSNEGVPGKKKVLRQSPGLKIDVEGKMIERISPTLKSIDKITAILNEEQSKKKSDVEITVSWANFTATLNGTYYNCYAELNDPGPYDWYLINWYTGVYTYIGSSTDYINFNVQKPSMYGSYRIWGEGPYGAGFTGYQYMGDPYTGVSLSGGMLSFTNLAAYNALSTRLKDAYESHQTFLDQYDNLSDDAADAAAISAGFNQFLPYEEFEAHFLGRTSLRAQIQGEVDYWLSQTHTDMSDFPADNYFPYSYEDQTLMTSEGNLYLGGEWTVNLPTISGYTYPASPGALSCMFQAKKKGEDTYGSSRTVKKKVLISSWTNDATKFVGNSQTFKKSFIGKYTPSLQRQQARVYGNYYDPSCVYLGTFDSGPTNTLLRRRYSQRAVELKNVNHLASKSGEFSMDVVISSVGTFTQIYSH